MDKTLIQTLKLLNKYGELNYYQIKMHINYFDYLEYCEKMFFLLDNNYIYFINKKIDTKYKYNTEDKTHEIIPQDLFFSLKTEGKNKLSEILQDEKRFKINSIIVPFIVAVITSILTAYLTIKFT